MNIPRMQTYLEIRNMLTQMKISSEGLGDPDQKILWKVEQKGKEMGNENKNMILEDLSQRPIAE